MPLLWRAWLCSQSLDFWAYPGTTRACCSCPTHVNCVNCVCATSRGGTKARIKAEKNEIDQNLHTRQHRNQSPTYLKPFATSDILDTTEMGRYRELAPEPQMRRAKWKIRIFLAHVCQGLSFLRFHLLAFGLLE